MSDKIYKHPTILYQHDIADICRPLQKLGITYFSHVNINQNGFSAIANHPDFHIHYLETERFNNDIHMAKANFIKDYVAWDFIKSIGKNETAIKEAAELGVRHTFTMIEKSENGNNYFHFATRHTNPSINQAYLANLDMLKLFVLHFKNNVAESRKLQAAYDIKFNLDHASGGFDMDGEFIPDGLRLDFLRDLKLTAPFRLANGKSLSTQQINILLWLHKGKTVSDIAAILGLAEITVNKHIAIIKNKTGCYTQFQLGEVFERFLANCFGANHR